MVDVTAEKDAFAERYYFLVRRLHSLTGIVPVGVFLCIHLSVNASIIAGPGAFQFAVDQIHNLSKLGILQTVEVLFIILPIAFHAVVGILIWLTSKPNVMAYQYCGNARYLLQRWTGLIALMFILVHLWHIHWIIPGGTEFDAHRAAASAAEALDRSWTSPVYAVGIVCTVYHLANGIWTFLIVWGITITPKAQARSAYFCAAIGIILLLLGLGSLRTFRTMDRSKLAPPAVFERHAVRDGGGTDAREAFVPPSASRPSTVGSLLKGSS
ncbi:MAG: succinate dehydrogenase [Phycisphaerae bacterium]